MVGEDGLSAVLSEFARTMVTDFPIQSVLDRLAVRIVELLPVSSVGVTLIEPGLAPRCVATSSAVALQFEMLQTANRQGPCLLAYDSGEVVSAPQLSADTRFPLFSAEAVDSGLAAAFAFPLNRGTGPLGALDLYRDTEGDLSAEDVVTARTLADVAAAYLINAQAREDDKEASAKFEASSLHDPLTGLPNRLLLDQRLAHAALRARRDQSSAAVLFADLHGFKDVNDSYGHQVGDELLVAVAQRLSSLLRPGDTLARVSGAEFVFLCEDLRSVAVAQSLANRIDAAFVSPFVLQATKLIVTASVGIAFAGPAGEISGQLMASANSAMYRAQRIVGNGPPGGFDIRDRGQWPPDQPWIPEPRDG